MYRAVHFFHLSVYGLFSFANVLIECHLILPLFHFISVQWYSSFCLVPNKWRDRYLLRFHWFVILQILEVYMISRLTIETILWLDNLNGNMMPKIFWDVKRDINLTKLFSKRKGGKEQTTMISVAM